MDDARGINTMIRLLAIPIIRKASRRQPRSDSNTARVQRAKRLLDDTKLPMIEIALLAGFRSLRRFNAVFAEVYKRPPTEIRRGQRNG
jgi:AraC family transcriptional regulator of adaptative response / DNA-3-methyladenine glycosylase II